MSIWSLYLRAAPLFRLKLGPQTLSRQRKILESLFRMVLFRNSAILVLNLDQWETTRFRSQTWTTGSVSNSPHSCSWCSRLRLSERTTSENVALCHSTKLSCKLRDQSSADLLPSAKAFRALPAWVTDFFAGLHPVEFRLDLERTPRHTHPERPSHWSGLGSNT